MSESPKRAEAKFVLGMAIVLAAGASVWLMPYFI